MRHNLFMGGAGPNGAGSGAFNGQMFPSVPADAEQYWRIDARRTPATGGITRHLVWKRPTGPKRTTKPLSPALASYLDNNPVAAGDELAIIMLPKYSVLEMVWWRVVEPLAGFDFNLTFEDPGPPVSTTPITTAPVNAGAQATGLIDMRTLLGNPLYVERNSLIRLDVVNLPASGIRDSYVEITAIVTTLEFGGN